MIVEKLISDVLQRPERTGKTLADAFLNANNKAPRYAIGKNAETVALNSIVPLQGIIDDYSVDTQGWKGIPLVRTGQVPKDALIANCSTALSPVAVLRHLRDSGLTNVVCVHELIGASGDALQWPGFVLSQRKEVANHLSAWEDIYTSLADDISRQTFLDVVRFRLSADPGCMANYSVRLAEQYFEDFMRYSNEVFVDAGGFDGDTSQAFADRYPDYRKIIFFEPSARNMQAARARLAAYRNIEYHSIGLSDEAGSLQFNQDAGSASSVTSVGGDSIQVDALDSAVHEPVTFIKMDLEGWEMRALMGAKGHIRDNRPKLAIAVYHDAPDFRLVHQFVSGCGHEYKVHIRHYTQGWSETIMFFS